VVAHLRQHRTPQAAIGLAQLAAGDRGEGAIEADIALDLLRAVAGDAALLEEGTQRRRSLADVSSLAGVLSCIFG
jgi:hypothetical protein